MILSAIAAVGPHGEIGHKGGLPWPRLSRDMRRFREITTAAGVVIMGRRTWHSLPVSPLPGRVNIVLSRTWPGYQGPVPLLGCDVVTSPGPAGALAAAESCTDGGRRGEAVVIGGRRCYTALWDRVARLYITAVGGPAYPADTFFPFWPPDPAVWRETAREEFPDERPCPLTFLTYERRSSDA